MLSNERPCFFHGIKNAWSMPELLPHKRICCYMNEERHICSLSPDIFGIKIPKTCTWNKLFIPNEIFTPDETEVLIQQGGWDASYKPLVYISPCKPTLLALEISNSHNAEILFYPLITLIRNSRISIFHTTYIHHILPHLLWNILKTTQAPNMFDLMTTSNSSNLVGACHSIP